MSTNHDNTIPTHAAVVRVVVSVPVIIQGDGIHDALKAANRQAEAVTGGTPFEIVELAELPPGRRDLADRASKLAYIGENDPQGRLMAAKQLQQLIQAERGTGVVQGVCNG